VERAPAEQQAPARVEDSWGWLADVVWITFVLAVVLIVVGLLAS
jgi:hypothetical protein